MTARAIGRRILSAWSLSFLLTVASAAQQCDLPLLSASDIPRAQIVTTRKFEGRALYGYIDGGADVYLEYGFVRLNLQSVDFDSIGVKIELYCMKDSAAAFGVYSISRHHCRQVDSIGRYACRSAYQVQFARGHHYVRVINTAGSPEAQARTLQVAAAISRKIKEPDASLPILFTDELLQPYLQNLYFFNGPLGLQNGLPEWIDLFDHAGSFQIFALPVERDSLIVARVRFASKGQREQFLKRGRSEGEGPARVLIPHEENEVFLIQYSGPPSALSSYFDLLKRQ